MSMEHKICEIQMLPEEIKIGHRFKELEMGAVRLFVLYVLSLRNQYLVLLGRKKEKSVVFNGLKMLK